MFSQRPCRDEGEEGEDTVEGPPMFMRTTAGDRTQGRIGGRATSERWSAHEHQASPADRLSELQKLTRRSVQARDGSTSSVSAA